MPPIQALLGILFALPPVGPQESAPGDQALAPLAAALGTYFEARASGLGLDEARAALAEAAPPLATPAELGRAVWLAEDRGGQRLRPGKVVLDEHREGSFVEAGLPYAYRLPKDYDPQRGGGYPLILAIPDVGEEPAAHLRDAWTHRPLLGAAVLVCPAMPAGRAEWNAVMVQGRPGGLSHALTALRLAQERFALDPDRVFVAGRGKRVPAAVAAGNFAPQRFAGIVGRAGDLGQGPEQGPQKFSNLPTWFAGGGARATAFGKAAAAAGFDDCTQEQAHADFKQALQSGRLHANQIEALTEALAAHTTELGAFAQP